MTAEEPPLGAWRRSRDLIVLAYAFKISRILSTNIDASLIENMAPPPLTAIGGLWHGRFGTRHGIVFPAGARLVR